MHACHIRQPKIIELMCFNKLCSFNTIKEAINFSITIYRQVFYVDVTRKIYTSPSPPFVHRFLDAPTQGMYSLDVLAGRLFNELYFF